MNIMTPTIHLNGMSEEEHIELRQTAYVKLGDAISALCQMSPHMRDYYCELNNAFKKDQEIHRERLLVLETMRNDLVSECDVIRKQKS